MKETNKKILSLISTLTTKAAADATGSVCILGLYQPKEPKLLQNK